MSILDPLYEGVAHAIVGIHSAIEPVFGKTNGYGWALSIVLLTLAVRLILFPLFVKQIKSQRTMQLMAPKMKEIKEKYKNDKQKMNQEMMALQKEHGNPLLGCLPIFAQIPLFIALFRVLRAIQPKEIMGVYTFQGSYGLSAPEAQSIGTAKIFGVPLAAAFRSTHEVLVKLGVTSGTTVKVLAVILIIVMSSTTYLTQKQIQGRNPSADPQQRAQQRLFLYLAPLGLVVSGFIFPIGAMVYYLTTNFWSMGQQFFVLRKMPPVVPVALTGAERAALKDAPPPPVKSGLLRPKPAAPKTPAIDYTAPRPKLKPERVITPPTTTPVSGVASSRPAGTRPPRKNSKSKNRRGGRR